MINSTCYIGLGSNIGDSISIINDATTLLGRLPKTTLVKSSSLYYSDPISDVKQNKFINAVTQLETQLKPYELLLELQAIESAFYRQRDNEIKWGPRTLDLDIILFGNEQFKDSHLTIPHAEMHNRLFVLQPLFDISGEMTISGLGSLSSLIKHAPEYELHKLDV